jgi:predicted restriction endonuclease
MARIPPIRQGIARAGCPTQNGPDTEDNILCLCPNHYTLFDLGAFTLADDFTLIGVQGLLPATPT